MSRFRLRLFLEPTGSSEYYGRRRFWWSVDSRLGVLSLCMSSRPPVPSGTAPHGSSSQTRTCTEREREGRGGRCISIASAHNKTIRVSRQLPAFSHRSGWFYCVMCCPCKEGDWVVEPMHQGCQERRIEWAEGGRQGPQGPRPAAAFPAALELTDGHRRHPGNINTELKHVVVSLW